MVYNLGVIVKLLLYFSTGDAFPSNFQDGGI